jgi:hypothetical protein
MIPSKYSETDKSEIDAKISKVIHGHRHQIVFFEYNTDQELFYLTHFGHQQFSFSINDITKKEVRKLAEKLLSEAFSLPSHIISFKNFTIIDGVYHKISTTCTELESNRNFHGKVPNRTKLYAKRFGCHIAKDFLRNTFDNLNRKAYVTLQNQI